jgi:hypothetical protein
MRYQIVRKPRAGTEGNPARWRFVAHGATYSPSEAQATCDGIRDASGDITKLLPVKG